MLQYKKISWFEFKMFKSFLERQFLLLNLNLYETTDKGNIYTKNYSMF